MGKKPDKRLLELLVYVITSGKEIIYATTDANLAIAKSIELAMDQHEHELKIWFGDESVGSIGLIGKIQLIF